MTAERYAAVAGQFYPGTEQELRVALSRLIPRTEQRSKVLGVIAPHAGYVYSGAVAGQLYGRLELPRTVLILGPNHRGSGAAAALYPDGVWQTPLGATPVVARLNELLLQHCPYLQTDAVAHQLEHSLEVQIPFLQYLRPDVTIAALCLGHGDYPALHEIGRGIAAALAAYGEAVLIVASSDMTHYESAEVVRRKDGLALDRAVALDGKGLLEICRSEKISMCGVVPSVIMIEAALAGGATTAELTGYATSGDVSGDNAQVVGYAAVTVS